MEKFSSCGCVRVQSQKILMLFGFVHFLQTEPAISEISSRKTAIDLYESIFWHFDRFSDIYFLEHSPAKSELMGSMGKKRVQRSPRHKLLIPSYGVEKKLLWTW